MGTSLAIIGPSAAHTSKHAQQSLKRKGGRSEHRHPQSRRSDCACLHARLSESWCLLRRLHAGKSSVPALKERRRLGAATPPKRRLPILDRDLSSPFGANRVSYVGDFRARRGKNIWPCNPWMPVAYLETEPRGALEHPVFYALHHRLGIER